MTLALGTCRFRVKIKYAYHHNILTIYLRITSQIVGFWMIWTVRTR